MARKRKLKLEAGMVVFKDFFPELYNRYMAIKVENPLRRTNGCLVPARCKTHLEKFGIKTRSGGFHFNRTTNQNEPLIYAIGCQTIQYESQEALDQVEISQAVKDFMLTWENEDFIVYMLEEVTLAPIIASYQAMIAGFVEREEPDEAIVVDDIGDGGYHLTCESRYRIRLYNRAHYAGEFGEWIYPLIDQMNEQVNQIRKELHAMVSTN